MRRIGNWLALLGMALALAACARGERATMRLSDGQKRPNILLVVADDIGIDAATDMYPGLIEALEARYGTGGLNHPQWQAIDGQAGSTPVLDRFASEAMRFTQAWANPLGPATRASLLTGLGARETRVLSEADALDQRHDSFVARLREAGYATGMFGKWHLAGQPGRDGAPDYPGIKPAEAGFDWFQGSLHAALPSYWNWEQHVQDFSMPADRWRTEQPVARELPGIAPTRNTDVVKVAQAIDWMREREELDPGRPWFGWLAFDRPRGVIPEADLLDTATRAAIRACGGNFGTSDTGACPQTTRLRATTNAMDTLMGQVLRAIDGLEGETYVIFIGDNGTPGDHIGNMYITREPRAKGTLWQSGVHVPLVVRGPGIAPGAASDAVVHAADLYPTILALAGLDVPRRVAAGSGPREIAIAGRSLLPVLRGREPRVRDFRRDVIIGEGADGQLGIRNGQYKLVCTPTAAACDFFDLLADPLEEYPLPRPADCADSRSWQGIAGAWDYCHLVAALATRSALANP